MNADIVQAKLIEVLQLIQSTSGEDCPLITGATKPAEELPRFDSKMWPVAIALVAKKLEITIANDVNIFCREKSCIALTIDETVAILVELANTQIAAANQTGGAK
jgi:hypothetical protein